MIASAMVIAGVSGFAHTQEPGEPGEPMAALVVQKQ